MSLSYVLSLNPYNGKSSPMSKYRDIKGSTSKFQRFEKEEFSKKITTMVNGGGSDIWRGRSNKK